MKKKLFLVLLFTIITVIQPAFAQPARDESGEPAATKETTTTNTTKEKETVININLASDDELNQALDKASDVELVNEEHAKNEESGKKPKQGGAK